MAILNWEKRSIYVRLLRLDRPIGSLLVMWPGLWALWLAAGGLPDLGNIVIFIAGSFVMRSAGCAINDYADRNIDGRVARTNNRPLATGEASGTEALALFSLLALLAFQLVIMTNTRTVYLAFGGLALAAVYPFVKRISQAPQLVLGLAFAWPIPMAFSAQAEQLPTSLWLLYFATILWIVVYDTFYAMVDRPDDLKIGVKSTAILFGQADAVICGLLQVCFVLLMAVIGRLFDCGAWYFAALVAVVTLFIWQQYQVSRREASAYFAAFLNNNWVGALIFLGIALNYLTRPAS